VETDPNIHIPSYKANYNKGALDYSTIGGATSTTRENSCGPITSKDLTLVDKAVKGIMKGKLTST
tara:strand:- start:524 stop:718 length:195 start_codon:yes stop_codon:yes gene_type:complete